MAGINTRFTNLKGDVDGGPYALDNSRRQDVLLDPDGITIRVARNTITTTYQNRVYRRVGDTLVFKLAE